MSFYRDKHIRGYGLFLVLFSVLLLSMLSVLYIIQRSQIKALYITQNERIVSSLLEQGVSKEVAANALLNIKTSEVGKNLLDMLGVHAQAANDTLPVFSEFQRSLFFVSISIAVFLIFVLFFGTALFFEKRKKLYVQANEVIDNYIGGDFSAHLPQNGEGAVFQLFSSIERLATMLQSKNEMEHQTKEFLKNTISDNGDGIAPEDIYHIWKRFYRSKYTLKTAGIGLGLPLAKSIVEGQGGTISVRSTLGQGTIFTLSFLTGS